VPTNQILILVAAGVFLVLWIVRRRARLKKDM
jgi:hypothetical protein